MTKVPSWRAKAMYIMFAFALVFGLAAAVITAAPASAQLSLFVTASPDKGSSPLTVDFYLNSNTGQGPYNVTWDLDGDGACDDSSDMGVGLPQTFTKTLPGSNDVVTCKACVTDTAPEGDSDSIEINIGLDPTLLPDPQPGAARDVKGSWQKFVVVNVPNAGVSAPEMVALIAELGGQGALQSTDPAVQAEGPETQVVGWTVTPGKAKNTIGDIWSGADLIIKGGGPTYPLPGWKSYIDGGYNASNPVPQQNYIEVWTWDPGDCVVKAFLDEDLEVDSGSDGILDNDMDIVLASEKKWGELYRTVLDLDADTLAWDTLSESLIPGAVDGLCTDPEVVAAGEVEDEVYEMVADWVIAEFLTSEDPSVERFKSRAGHAQVNWWLIVDDEDHLNEAYIKSIIDDLDEGYRDDCSGCGRYAAWGNTTPRDMIDELAYGDVDVVGIDGEQQAAYTAWSDIPVLSGPGYIGAGSNYDSSIWPHADDIDDPQFAWTTTQGDLPGETRGLTEIELENWGEENVLVVTLVEYPEDYSGENPICIEIGKKRFVEEPEYPITMVKTPQLRWAGEKIVLENDWTDVIDSLNLDCEELIAVYHLDGASIGTLYPAGNNAAREKDGGDIWVKVAGCSPGPSDPVSEVILESEFQGKADVEVSLYYGNWPSPRDLFAEPIIMPPGSPIINTGFVVFYLALEEITWSEDFGSEVELLEPKALPEKEGDSADLVVEIKGWFTSPMLGLGVDPVTNAVREEKLQDCDNDDYFESALPRGRWVMPDDWVRLAGGTGAITTRPNWDMMDKANNDPIEGEIESTNRLGPYTGPVKTTLDPGKAMSPNIGPFSTLQRWSVEDMWITAATVPSSLLPGLVRNTVIPDGELTKWDAPMPQALVSFKLTDPPLLDATLSALDKGDLLDYGYILRGAPAVKYFQSPFYAVEIPSSMFITAEGYNYDSWAVDAPYDYWMDLGLRSRISDTREPVDRALKTEADLDDVEVYSDNHGIAGVTVDALPGLGDVIVVATVDFPNILKTAQYCAMVSAPKIVSWGAKEMNPSFLADEKVVEAGDLVTFTNETVGGERPYVRAQWDFDEDGIWDKDLTGTEAQVLADAIWDTTGVPTGKYTVLLCMTDSEGIQRCEDRLDYITITGGGDPDPEMKFKDWPFPFDAYAPRSLPDTYEGKIWLDDLEPDYPIPDCVQAIYYEGEGSGIQFWAPPYLDGGIWKPVPGTTLKFLGGSHTATTGANYNIVAYGTPCTWNVPLIP